MKPLRQRFQTIDLASLDLSKLDDKTLLTSIDIKYTPRSHPLFKIVQTLLLLAECFSFSQKYEHTLEIFEFCQKVYAKLFGTDLTVLNSYVIQQIADTYCKMASERMQKPLEKAVEFGQKSIDMMKAIIGENVNNSLLAFRIQTKADALRDSEKYEESEALYRQAQEMIGAIWGAEHPFILQYNGNMITTLNIKMTHQEGVTEEQKAEIKTNLKQIIDKNYDIALKTFGLESIHMLFYISQTLTNRVALGEIDKPTLANPMIK